MEFIVTDLTRFKKGNPNACLAGLDPKTKQCVRPYPYLKMVEYQKLDIVPGVILSWELKSPKTVKKPHIEDMDYFLRIGLSRKFDHQDGRSGYWIQVNGIYTFPEFLTAVRTYDPAEIKKMSRSH